MRSPAAPCTSYQRQSHIWPPLPLPPMSILYEHALHKLGAVMEPLGCISRGKFRQSRRSAGAGMPNDNMSAQFWVNCQAMERKQCCPVPNVCVWPERILACCSAEAKDPAGCGVHWPKAKIPRRIRWRLDLWGNVPSSHQSNRPAQRLQGPLRTRWSVSLKLSAVFFPKGMHAQRTNYLRLVEKGVHTNTASDGA